MDMHPINSASNYWQRTGTVISPRTAGDDITTTGTITGEILTDGLFQSDDGVITGVASITSIAGYFTTSCDFGVSATSNYTSFSNAGTMTLHGLAIITASGDLTITAAGGDISFDNEHLATTGNMTATSHVAGNLTISSNSISNVTADLTITAGGGDISFDNENLTTTGWMALGAGKMDMGAEVASSLKAVRIKDSAGTWQYALLMDGGNNLRLQTLNTGPDAGDFYLNSGAHFIVKYWKAVGINKASPDGMFDIEQTANSSGMYLHGKNPVHASSIHTFIDSAGNATITSTGDLTITPVGGDTTNLGTFKANIVTSTYERSIQMHLNSGNPRLTFSYQSAASTHSAFIDFTSADLFNIYNGVGDTRIESGNYMLVYGNSRVCLYSATAVTIGDATGVTNYTKFLNNGDLSFVGTAGFYPRVVNQNTIPANGTGATQIDTGELIIWTDADDSNKAYLVFNNGAGGVVKVALA